MPSKKSTPKEPTERLFLIDSFSHIFRAFFAPMGGRTEPLRNSSGQVTPFATGLGAPFGLVFRTTPSLALFVTDYLSGNVIQFTPNSR